MTNNITKHQPCLPCAGRTVIKANNNKRRMLLSAYILFIIALKRALSGTISSHTHSRRAANTKQRRHFSPFLAAVQWPCLVAV
jgi:hypothetical protein